MRNFHWEAIDEGGTHELHQCGCHAVDIWHVPRSSNSIDAYAFHLTYGRAHPLGKWRNHQRLEEQKKIVECSPLGTPAALHAVFRFDLRRGWRQHQWNFPKCIAKLSQPSQSTWAGKVNATLDRNLKLMKNHFQEEMFRRCYQVEIGIALNSAVNDYQSGITISQKHLVTKYYIRWNNYDLWCFI